LEERYVSPQVTNTAVLTKFTATLNSKKPSLFLTIISVLRWELLGIMPPRIGMIALSISQPFLVSSALRFLTMPESESTMNLGYGLIGAFAFVFIGSAV
jgi:hypothetical protein